MSKYKNGVLVVSHGPLATSIVSSAEMIVGKISDERLETLTLDDNNNLIKSGREFLLNVKTIVVEEEEEEEWL